jgi:threonine dehydratase
MDEACRWLWQEMSIASDPSGAASVAALLVGAYKPRAGEKVCALICGAGPESVELGQ